MVSPLKKTHNIPIFLRPQWSAPHVNLLWMFCEGRDSLNPEPLWIIHLESSRAIFIHLVNCHQKSSQTHTAGEKICSKGQIRNFGDRFLERFLSKHSPSDNAKSSRCLWCQILWLFGVSSGSGEMHKGNSTAQLAIFIYSKRLQFLFKSFQISIFQEYPTYPTVANLNLWTPSTNQGQHNHVASLLRSHYPGKCLERSHLDALIEFNDLEGEIPSLPQAKVLASKLTFMSKQTVVPSELTWNLK